MIEGKSFTREHVYLPSLAVVSARLDGYRFKDCRIMGPAVVAILDGANITGVTFELGGSDMESMLIEVPEGKFVVGVIGLGDVVIENCTLANIAFIGPPETLDKIRVSTMGI